MSFTSDRFDDSWITNFNLKELSLKKRILFSIGKILNIKFDVKVPFAIKEVDTLLKNVGANIIHQYSHKFYVEHEYVYGFLCLIPKTWNYEIHIPLPELFQGDELAKQKYYYFGLFHELTHWTGDPKRLNRRNEYGTNRKFAYACEEIVAAFGGELLLKKFGLFDQDLDNRTVSYVSGYLYTIVSHLLKTNAIKTIPGYYLEDYLQTAEVKNLILYLRNLAYDSLDFLEKGSK